MLKAKNISKSYQERQVLKNASMEVCKGEMVAIMGSSGAGKSTLLHILGTLDTADTGELWLNSINVNTLKGNHLATFRNKNIGFVFQNHNLLPEFNALENMIIPALIAGIKPAEAEKSARELAVLLGIDHVLENKPSQLSGGEQQRTAVARAVINKPAILLADEPTGNLDVANAESLHRLLSDLKKEFQQTIITVTHNPDLAALCDRTLYMREGHLYEHP